MIRVLIVNDSLVAVQAMKRILATDPDIELAGVAADGVIAVTMAESLKPDVILMDIEMPNKNGVEATREIMVANPCPILIVSTLFDTNKPFVYEALRCGALEAIKSPAIGALAASDQSGQTPGISPEAKILLSKVHTMHLLKDIAVGRVRLEGTKDRKDMIPLAEKAGQGNLAEKVIAIGASAGGPGATLEVLSGLPENIKAGILISQHMDEDFTKGLADWLNSKSRIKVCEAKNGDRVLEGVAFVARGGAAGMVVNEDKTISYKYLKEGLEFTPSINMMLQSVAKVYRNNALGVILSGMGDDGAVGLGAIRLQDGLTVAQDEETSIIYGMPKVAKEKGAAKLILPLSEISRQIIKWVQG
ncbi:MAG: chemotaxis-specific protein-glutamate methyltransferase CheB [Deltaproteobacteria bacterium]|nr:chemotaxis-specific protein-glutamate methyltransferase CheB [Deltaproteobacteria bacterium]